MIENYQVAVDIGIPGEAVALLAVALEAELGRAVAARVGLGRMLGVVEYEHVARGRLGGDDALILGHVAGSIHLALVVDAYLDLDLAAD